MCCEIFSLKFEVNLDEDPGTFGGLTTNRKCTDLLGLIIMVLFFVTVIGLTVHCINNREIEKLYNGYDDCGNICGKNNIKTKSVRLECFGKNMEQKKYVLIKEDAQLGRKKECVANCTIMKGITIIYNYCVSDRNFLPFYFVFFAYWRILICLIICIFYGIRIHSLLFTDYIKYYLACESIISGALSTIILYFLFDFVQYYITNDSTYFKNLLFLGIVPIVVFIMIVPSFCYYSIKSEIIIEFYEHLNETFFFWFSLYLLPLLSCIIISLFMYVLIYCFTWVHSFSYLDQIHDESSSIAIIDYVQYPIATITQALLIFAFLLLCEFLKNLQSLVICGYVAQWYFSEDDDEESDSTITPLLKKHLGTLCCGTIILTATSPIRIVVNALKAAGILSYKECLYTCARPLLTETLFVKCFGFFTRSAFVMTAIHGSPFCAGTLRARKLLYHNVFNAAAIYTFAGNGYLHWKIICWFFSIVFGFMVFRTYCVNFQEGLILLVFAGIICAILIDCYASVLEIIINTMFLCFCEDCLYNDGASNPYFMTADFAQFVERANKYVDPKKWKTVAADWKRGPKLLY